MKKTIIFVIFCTFVLGLILYCNESEDFFEIVEYVASFNSEEKKVSVTDIVKKEIKIQKKDETKEILENNLKIIEKRIYLEKNNTTITDRKRLIKAEDDLLTAQIGMDSITHGNNVGSSISVEIWKYATKELANSHKNLKYVKRNIEVNRGIRIEKLETSRDKTKKQISKITPKNTNRSKIVKRGFFGTCWNIVVETFYVVLWIVGIFCMLILGVGWWGVLFVFMIAFCVK